MLTRLSFSGLALGLLIYLSSFAAFTQPLSLIEKSQWGSSTYSKAVSIGDFVFAAASTQIDIFDRTLDVDSSLIGKKNIQRGAMNIEAFNNMLLVSSFQMLQIYSISDEGGLAQIYEFYTGLVSEACFTVRDDGFYLMGIKDETFQVYSIKYLNEEFSVSISKKYEVDNASLDGCSTIEGENGIHYSKLEYSSKLSSYLLREIFIPYDMNEDDFYDRLNYGVYFDGNFNQVRYLTENTLVLFSRNDGELVLVKVENEELIVLDRLRDHALHEGNLAVGDQFFYLVKDYVSVFSIDSLDRIEWVSTNNISGIDAPFSSPMRVEFKGGKLLSASEDFGIFEVTMNGLEIGSVKRFFNQSGSIINAAFVGDRQYVLKNNTIHVVDMFKKGGAVKYFDTTLLDQNNPNVKIYNDRLISLGFHNLSYYSINKDYSLKKLISGIPSCYQFGWAYTPRFFVHNERFYVYCYNSSDAGYKLFGLNIESDDSLYEPPVVIEVDDSTKGEFSRFRHVEFMFDGDVYFAADNPGGESFFLYKLDDLKSSLVKVGDSFNVKLTNPNREAGNAWLSKGRYFISEREKEEQEDGCHNSNLSIYRINEVFGYDEVARFDGGVSHQPFMLGEYLFLFNIKKDCIAYLDVYKVKDNGDLDWSHKQVVDDINLYYYDKISGSENKVLLGNNKFVSAWELNFSPELNDFQISVEEDNQFNWDLERADREGDSIDVEVLVEPNSGSLEFLPEQKSLSYTPNVDFFGTDIMSIKLSDEHGNFHEYQLTVDVLPVNDAPVMSSMTGVTVKNSTLTGQLMASDAEQDTVSFSLFKAPQYGQVTISSEGAFEYTPNNDFVGADYFDVEALDDKGAKSQGRVSIEVKAENLAPSLGITQFTLDEDTAKTFTLDVSNDDGSEVTLLLGDVSGLQGLLELLGEHRIQFTPSADFYGETQATLVLTDKLGASKTETLTFVVQAVDDPPRPQAQSVSAKAGTTHKGQLANQDIDGDTLIYAVLQTTSNGALTLNANGSYSYTPNTGFSGTDKFTYQVSDSNGNTAQSEVQISVAKASTPPPATSSDSSGGGTLSWLLLALLWLSYLHQRRWVTKCYIGTGNS
ncbi:Ig-like domain-containing protein [Bowmanella pacifica]|uniref:Tandem-95 repeat protein n=1 Tax=Bowmanella pacifica TaxID=502051 RepID=A0A917Z7A8_9ALTE|nr:Ig-like domain-containing protein [Bowmanella pacifica]GGO74826.1 hypothetical protein GCM10010982_38570 [Bowmanella pacifica]